MFPILLTDKPWYRRLSHFRASIMDAVRVHLQCSHRYCRYCRMWRNMNSDMTHTHGTALEKSQSYNMAEQGHHISSHVLDHFACFPSGHAHFAFSLRWQLASYKTTANLGCVLGGHFPQIRAEGVPPAYHKKHTPAIFVCGRTRL